LGIREVAITQDDNTPSLTQGEGLRWVVNRRKTLPFWFNLKFDVSFYSFLNTGDLQVLTGSVLSGSQTTRLRHNQDEESRGQLPTEALGYSAY
jgi:hypothetical protein